MAGGPIRLDDLESLQIQAFIATVEESSQQGQRTPRPLDQGGFGGGPDLRVVGHHAICPVKHRRSSWKVRTLGLSEYWYRQNAKQRADEHVSHGPARRCAFRTGSWCRTGPGALAALAVLVDLRPHRNPLTRSIRRMGDHDRLNVARSVWCNASPIWTRGCRRRPCPRWRSTAARASTSARSPRIPTRREGLRGCSSRTKTASWPPSAAQVGDVAADAPAAGSAKRMRSRSPPQATGRAR